MNKITTSMKGLAIMFIAIHNLLGLSIYGYVQCNEKTFDVERLISVNKHLSVIDESIIGDFFSFIGWFGVPVFVFLSGYGLSRKYEKKNIDCFNYIKHSYLKLLVLILPAAIFYILKLLISGDYHGILVRLPSFTFLENLFRMMHLVPTYWYFSLTFQLYLLFILIKKINSNRVLITIAVSFLLLQGFIPILDNQSQELLRYCKSNFLGWISLFIVGVIMGRINRKEGVKYNIFSLICLTVFFLCLSWFLNYNYYIWLLLPFSSVVFFYTLAKLVSLSSIFSKLSNWIGQISPYIFVVHPLIAEPISVNQGISIRVALLLYLVLLFITVIIYKQTVIKLKTIIKF